MTKYCLQERAKVYEVYLNYFNNSTKENWLGYIKLVDNFKYRFHRRFDPLNLADDYDILGITLRRKEGKPFIPMELKKIVFNMIKEDYVSFETAKLLKEKGFEGHSIITIYDEDAANAYVKELIEKHLPYSSDDPKLKEFYYVKPTLQMAMKWLREVHNIDIIAPPQYDGIKWTYSAIIFKLSIPCIEIKLNDNKNKKEEACEEAIKYCLENLI